MRTTSSLVPWALLLAAACELPTQDLSPRLPDDRLLVEQNDSTAQARALGNPSGHAQTLTELTEQSNQGLEQILQLVGTITSLPPSWIDTRYNEVEWGPFIVNGVGTRLVLQGQPDDSVIWGIQLQPEDADDWTHALLGQIEPGATAEASEGRFTMDFAAAALLDLGDDLDGEVSVEYELRDGGATSGISFGDVASTKGTLPVDGAVHFDFERGVGGSMQTTLSEDVEGTTSPATESMGLHARWDAQGAGRTDVLLSGGDFGDQSHVESECWSAAHTVVFHSNTFTGASEGDEALCAFPDATAPGQ